MKRIFTAATAIALTSLFAASATSAEETVNLRFSHWLPATHPVHPKGFEVWTKSITEASNGSITFTFFPAQQLGKAKDHYDMARDGIADVIWTSPGYTPGRFPIFAASTLPFQVTNAKKGSRAIDEWYRNNRGKEMSDVHHCIAFAHDPGTLHTKEKITHPSQLAGKKVRPANSTIARLATELGGASVQVSAPEARDAIDKGTADMITFPWNSLRLFGIHNSASHHLDMPFYVAAFVLSINPAAYGKMSDAQKKIIDDHCNPEWAEKMASGWADWEAAGRADTMKDDTQTMHTPTGDEIQAWREASAPLYDAWKKDVSDAGGDPDAILKDFHATLAKHDSLYKPGE